ncbi:hypothetical protein BGZ63DRAFT_27267 [Mariannaea sp. PMI_226]|nr:hypothetical protein BGZ63DRAFT_27267 [Mariannaea sp. PMI_226]
MIPLAPRRWSFRSPLTLYFCGQAAQVLSSAHNCKFGPTSPLQVSCRRSLSQISYSPPTLLFFSPTAKQRRPLRTHNRRLQLVPTWYSVQHRHCTLTADVPETQESTKPLPIAHCNSGTDLSSRRPRQRGQPLNTDAISQGRPASSPIPQ